MTCVHVATNHPADVIKVTSCRSMCGHGRRSPGGESCCAAGLLSSPPWSPGTAVGSCCGLLCLCGCASISLRFLLGLLAGPARWICTLVCECSPGCLLCCSLLQQPLLAQLSGRLAAGAAALLELARVASATSLAVQGNDIALTANAAAVLRERPAGTAKVRCCCCCCYQAAASQRSASALSDGPRSGRLHCMEWGMKCFSPLPIM